MTIDRTNLRTSPDETALPGALKEAIGAALMRCLPVVVSDAAGTILFVNDAGVSLLRASGPDDLVGRAAMALFRPECRDILRQRFAALLSGTDSVPVSETVMIAMDGSEISVEAQLVAHDLDGGQIVLAVCNEIAGRREFERRLQQERDYANAVLDSLPGVFYHYENHRLKRWNRNHETVTGYSGKELMDLDALTFFPEEYKGPIAQGIREVFERGASSVEADYLLKDGQRIPYLFTGMRFEYDGRQGFVGVGTDISERRRIEDALREKTALFEAQLESSEEGILVVDRGHRKVIQNHRLAEVWKIPAHIADDPDGLPQLEFILGRVKSPTEFRAKVDWLIEHPEEISQDEIELLDGTVLDRYSGPVLDGDGRNYGRIWTFRDITERRRADQHIRQLAHYDVLTSLPNRISFLARLNNSLMLKSGRVGLLYIDLDGFKLINDTRGHPTGDALLRRVAERLKKVCDRLAVTAGRLGGDEFAVIFPCGQAEEAAAFGAEIIDALRVPHELDRSRNVLIGASIGIALAPDHGSAADTLLTRADIALYAAKADGKGVCRIFELEMERRIQERMSLETSLRLALENRKGVFVFYQPVVEISTGRVTAREALMRWWHPLRGWISPSEFIPVAEESGLIDRLVLFVLGQACRDAAAWEDDEASVAVNVSTSQLGKGMIVPAIQQALAEAGLPPGRLEIEVTETALLSDEQNAIVDLQRIHDLGVRVALDDFGTGYSSLAHLRAFPFDKIKIDGSFVRDAVDRPDCAAVVRAVADLGKRLGVTTVAEGVETQEHLDCVRREGCLEVQGYFYGWAEPTASDAYTISVLNDAAGADTDVRQRQQL
ncbi:MAG TPA: EAL domain-containing protein [Granulicella sp.]